MLSVAVLLNFSPGLAPAISPELDDSPASRSVGRAGPIVETVNYIGLSAEGMYLNVTLSGQRFSGRLFVDGKYEIIRGFLDGGSYAGTYGKPQRAFSVARSLTGDRFTLTSFGRTVVAYPCYARTYTPSQEGYYTVLLKADKTNSSSPPGAGFAVARIKKGGQMTLVGKAADGTAIGIAGYLTKKPGGISQFVLFAPLYGGKGKLAGTVGFGSGSFASELNWTKPWQKTGTYYRSGFSTEIELAGCRYRVPTAGQQVLTFPGGAGVVLELAGGGLYDAVNESGVLTVANKLMILGTNSTKLKLSLNVKTGLLSGSFFYPQINKVVKIAGAIYQDAGAPEACGYFRSPVQNGLGRCGNFSLKAPTP